MLFQNANIIQNTKNFRLYIFIKVICGREKKKKKKLKPYNNTTLAQIVK